MTDQLETILRRVVHPNCDADVPALADRIKGMFPGFTNLEMEAALCVWECLNEWTLGTEEQVEAMRVNCEEHSHEALRLEWIEMREATGSGEMRSQSILLGKWCLEIYDILTKRNEDFFGYWSYDWEVIPAMLKHAVCKDGKASMYRGDYIYAGGELIDPHSAAQLVAQEFIQRGFDDECRREADKQWAYADLVTDDAGERMRQAFEIGEEPAALVKWLGEKFDLTPASGYF
ncbi:hypothetical protein [Bradyrhizobium ottawaense]|uniref:DUF4375 domain-containing protein n=1 Tax=Bradyrhizobium ottawaense TaxID=931866 RepID=A0ABY0QHC2_9BRAD|nr:hypothetical protein [Bradyrhizobium ottawaense]SDK43496.1 hypothetical protein SAMN05444163_8104 [Bradyrhizobium ottawaense]